MSMEEKQNFQTPQDFSISALKPDSEGAIAEAIKHCYKKNIPLEINGLGSKKNIGKNFQSEKTLDLSNYSGIIKYEPEELYIKVKSGTPIKEIKEELDKKINNLHLNQMILVFFLREKLTREQLVVFFQVILQVLEGLKLEVLEIIF